jgi:Spy/CpxP family protein refolding chaperone
MPEETGPALSLRGFWNWPAAYREYKTGRTGAAWPVSDRAEWIAREELKMSMNRKCLWILALVLAVPVLPGAAAAAYQGGGYSGGAREDRLTINEQLRRMTKTFNLTADQQSKLKPILIDERKKIDDVRDNTSLERSTMFDRIKQIRQDTDAKVRALLDDKQKETFDKMQHEREDRMKNRQGGPGEDNSGGNPPSPPPQN